MLASSGVSSQSNTWDLWNDRLPDEWSPVSFEDLNLVGCIESYEVDFARCEYTCTSSGSGFTVELIRNVMEVELREAQTGLPIARETFSGDSPWESCPETLPNCNSFRKKGSSITYNDVFVWLQRVSD